MSHYSYGNEEIICIIICGRFIFFIIPILNVSIKDELLRLLREDEVFRLAVVGLLGISDVQSSIRELVSAVSDLARVVQRLVEGQERLWGEVRALREDQGKLWEENNKIWQEVRRINENIEKLWQEVRALRENQEKLWEAVKSLQEGQNKLWEENRKIWEAIKALQEQVKALQEGQNALRADVNKLWEENNRINENIEKLWQENNRLWQEFRAFREDQERRWQENEKRWQENEKRWEEAYKRFEAIETELRNLREDFNRFVMGINRKLDALGARWGVISEEAFREGMKGVVEKILGAAKVEKWTYNDIGGEVYGHPAIIDVDIVVRDGTYILVEVKSSLSRGDVAEFWRIGRLYEKVNGIKPRLVMISPYVDDRAMELAKSLGIEIYTEVI
ncbi:hypothetical protein GCM10007112_04690 [Vulcanisaeta souniana JCM 11219]|uniref:DUF3782 domain-containing protein n=1 Tax=Vulcanisaeta souniana JCM 11219 TaxID=1293586 RepID=A0A830EF62_9CREN|nr:hypothetical protein GCM10007112_04690 [Vulcanisaeta souniana JCM 11219]